MPLVAEATKQGVLLVSPATLAINLNLLTVELQAMEISEKAEQIQKNLGKLSTSLKDVVKKNGTLYTITSKKPTTKPPTQTKNKPI